MTSTGEKTRSSLGSARYLLLGAVIVVCLLQLRLPNIITIGLSWVGPPLVEAPLALWIFFALRKPSNWTRPSVRRAVTVLLAVMVAGVCFNTAMLLTLLSPSDNPNGISLLLSCGAVLTMNILSFGLTYWWLDGGGPAARLADADSARDLQFPQNLEDEPWEPQPADYLYTAYTNVFAFSPTDTMPVTLKAKAVFTLQSAVALLTLLVTLGLAVNNLT